LKQKEGKVKKMVVVGMALLAAGCVSHGVAEDFKWKAEVPASVDKGLDMIFQVFATDGAGVQVKGMKYHYLVQWPGGTSNPLRRMGRTGENEKVRAGLQTGTALMVVTCADRSGNQAKVDEVKFEVK
jgi:hypothetical protein